LNQLQGDAPRLELTPNEGASSLTVTARARIRSVMPLPITAFGISCTVAINTTNDPTPPDLLVQTTITLSQDATTGTTRIAATNTSVSQLDDADYTVGGLCAILGDFITAEFIMEQLAGPIENTINGATCKSCSTVA